MVTTTAVHTCADCGTGYPTSWQRKLCQLSHEAIHEQAEET